MKVPPENIENERSETKFWEFLVLEEVYRDGRKELHVEAWPILNPSAVGEGCIYFDYHINRIACWGFDDLIDYSGPPPYLLEEAEAFFQKWLNKMDDLFGDRNTTN